MLNLEQAIEHCKRVGVRYYVKNAAGCIMGGTKTLEQAEAMKRRFEANDREIHGQKELHASASNPPDESRIATGRNALRRVAGSS